MEKKEIIEKIKKVLSLGGNNDNPNEVMAAVLKAHALMAKYGVTEDEIKEGKKEEVSKKEIHLKQWRFHVDFLSVISGNLRCDVVYSKRPIFSPLSVKSQYETVGVVYGSPTDIESVETLFNFVVKEVERLYKEYGKKGGNSKESYYYGFLMEFKRQLEKQSYDLMVVTPQEVKEKIKEDYQGRIATKKSSYSCNREDMEKGSSDCREMMNSRQLDERRGIEEKNV